MELLTRASVKGSLSKAKGATTELGGMHPFCSFKNLWNTASTTEKGVKKQKPEFD